MEVVMHIADSIAGLFRKFVLVDFDFSGDFRRENGDLPRYHRRAPEKVDSFFRRR